MHEVARRAGRVRANVGATLAVLAVLLPVVGCTSQNKENAAMSTDAEATTEAPPLRKLNPKPRHAYEIRMAFDNVPGPFASISGVAQYDVTNEEQCGQYLEFAGVHPRITSNEPFTLTRVSDTEYVGTVYVDRILDEDYFGRGVCTWAFTEVRAVLKASAADADTRFVADIPSEDITGKQDRTRYFWKGYYPRARVDGFGDFGDATLDSVPSDKRNEFFRVTLTARETVS